jgi:hypothetical protein
MSELNRDEKQCLAAAQASRPRRSARQDLKGDELPLLAESRRKETCQSADRQLKGGTTEPVRPRAC